MDQSLATTIQERIIEGVENSIDEGNNSAIEGPTGCGKSRIFSRISENGAEKGERTIILSARQFLAEQAIDNIEKWCDKDINVTLGLDGDLDQSGEVVSTTIQTANLHLDSLEHYDRAIIDEAHHAKVGNTDYEDIITALKAKNPEIKIVGTSATWPDDMSLMLPEFEKADRHVITFEEAIEAKLIDLPNTITPPHHLTKGGTIGDLVEEFRGKNKGADIEGIGREIKKRQPEDWNETLAWQYSKEFSGIQTISFFDTVKEANAFAKELRDFDIDVVPLHSGNSRKENERILSDFKSGKIPGIASVDMVSEGFDVDARGLFLAKRTTSKTEYRQIVGRGSRSFGESKEQKTKLVDMGASTFLHGEIGAQADINNLKQKIDGEQSRTNLAPESEEARGIWRPVEGTETFAATLGGRIIYAHASQDGYIAMSSHHTKKGSQLKLLEIDGQKKGRPTKEAFLQWTGNAIRQSEKAIARIMSTAGGIDAFIAEDWQRNASSVKRNVELMSGMMQNNIAMAHSQGLAR